jgi:hypothetical protein
MGLPINKVPNQPPGACATETIVAGVSMYRTWQGVRRRATALTAQPQVSSGRQWHDDQGRPLAYLDKAGLHASAAQVRAAHRRTSAPSAAAGTRTRESSSRKHASKRRRTDGISVGCSSGTPEGVPGQLWSNDDDEPLCDNSSPFVEPLGHATQPDQRQANAGAGWWTGGLINQPICMGWDSGTSTMTMPVAGSPVFHGFVQSLVEASDRAPGKVEYMCWFDDHSIQPVTEDTLRFCVLATAPSEKIQAMTAAAILVVAACRHVWGHDAMPPCVRDRGDGKSASAAVLVFGVKTLKVSRHGRSVIDAVDDRAAALVEFFEGRGDAGIQSSSSCSVCHSIAQQRQTSLCAHTSGAAPTEACPHTLAIRHMWRRTSGTLAMPDESVDSAIARLAVRGRPLDPLSEDPPTRLRGHTGEDKEGLLYPLIYPTADSCFFLVIQVRGYCIHPETCAGCVCE